MPRNLGRAEVQRCGKAEALGGNGEPALQEQPDGERQVEKDMGEDDPAQSVDRDSAKADRGNRVVQQSRPGRRSRESP